MQNRLSRFLLLAMIVASAAWSTESAAQCMWPRQEPGNNCCACTFGPGYWNCTPSCEGYCVVFDTCIITKGEINLTPDGSVLRQPRAEVASLSDAIGPRSAIDLLALTGDWEGRTTNITRDCRGYVVSRVYSREVVTEARTSSAIIEI